MQITDEQFIDAIHRAATVAPNRRAPGAYWDATAGVPYCVVGYALALISPQLCPTDNSQLAESLLRDLGCSPRVACAGEVAQYFNDAKRPWSEVGKAFDEALVMYDRGFSRYEIRQQVKEKIQGFMIGDVKVKIEQINTELKKISAAGLYANTAATTMANVSVTWSSSASTSTVFPSVSVSGACDCPYCTATKVPALAKKDHALTA